MFGFQSRASNADDPDVPGATRELVVDKMAKNLWNMTQLAESPNGGSGRGLRQGPSARFAVTKLHERTFAGYERWLEHTKFDDLSPQGAPPTLGSTHVNHGQRRQGAHQQHEAVPNCALRDDLRRGCELPIAAGDAELHIPRGGMLRRCTVTDER